MRARESITRDEWNEGKEREQGIATECDEEDECVSIRAVSCPCNPPTPIYAKIAPECSRTLR